MSLEELDRLNRFRESGKFINSIADFKEVTDVSQQWLDSISPYFKFPAWVTARNKNATAYSGPTFRKSSAPKDLNQANINELKEVYGIGPALSKRIVDERARLGKYVDMIQVRAVYGLTDSTIIRLKERFYVNESVNKIAINKATKDELLSVPYFNDYLVDELLKQRTLRESFSKWDEVKLTSRFPEEKLPLIQLYLTLD